MDGWMDGWIVMDGIGCMDGWIDGRQDGLIEKTTTEWLIY